MCIQFKYINNELGIEDVDWGTMHDVVVKFYS